MLARLILLLLVLASLPGMAAEMAAGRGCHEEAMTATRTMAAMPGMPAHHHGVPAAAHRCIGCMPLPEAVAVRVGTLAPHARLPRPVPVRFDLRAPAPPALPPPRIG